MFFPTEWHPFEIARSIELWFENLASDFDLRFPEARRRRALGFELQYPDLQAVSELAREFRQAKRTASYLDWPMLFEWNERWQVQELAADISRLNLNEHPEAPLPKAIFERLREIKQSFQSMKLDENPSLFQLFLYRWKMAPLREEATYLLRRLKNL